MPQSTQQHRIKDNKKILKVSNNLIFASNTPLPRGGSLATFLPTLWRSRGGKDHLCNLMNLLVLDLHNCNNVSNNSVVQVVHSCTKLIELDARDIQGGRSAKLSFTEKQRLTILNGKRIHTNTKESLLCYDTNTYGNTSSNYHKTLVCSARRLSQRLQRNLGARPQRMYHCIECKMIPSIGRGICSVCARTCHKGHEGVYFGSVTVFYCDCFFGITSVNCSSVKAIPTIVR